MPLLEMKLLKTDFALKARFRFLFTLFLIISGGLSLPQMTQRTRYKSQVDAHNHPVSYTVNLEENRLDLKDSSVEDLRPADALTRPRAKRKVGPLESTEHLHLDRREARDQDLLNYLAKPEVFRGKTRRHAAHELSKASRDPFSNNRRQESDPNIQDLDDYLLPKQQDSTFVDSNHLEDGRSSQSAPSDRFSIDSILNDVSVGKGSSDNVIDYYFVDDALLREGQQHHLRHSSVRHGVIINLTGLIPTADVDSEYDKAMGEGQNNENQDEILAYKAFEIRPSGVESMRLSPVISDSDDSHLNDETTGGGGGYVDYADHNKDASHHQSSDSRTTWHNKQEEDGTPDLALPSENRNLSRKRRQKSLPDQDDVDRQRRHFARRRRRKRKRRHRNGANRMTWSSSSQHHDGSGAATRRSGDERHSRTEVAEAPPVVLNGQERFLLKSNSPAYVITSASEVKKDWCKTVPFKQKVVEKNCKPRFITNNFCYGQCNSFFIPHVGRTGNGAAFQSCALCKPHKYKWTTVTLSCPRQEQQRVEKQVLIVESCRCKSETLQ